MRKSTSVYELEEKISNIEKNMERLTFVTKIHDANIQYILRKSEGSSSNNHTTQIKRQKTNDFNNDEVTKILRIDNNVNSWNDLNSNLLDTANFQLQT